ncbi:MAG: hypothetical protein A2096_02090 [Spirochaetes bacterium GWF1_41_5]|nr:MAG: hypothetical protein A2096_02090 [Spirochaetes bacterium GWF1_41_5]
MIKTGLIGCGVIGNVHAWAISLCPGAELRAVCDLDPKRAAEFAGRYKCSYETDLKKIINNPQIDAVSIALPHFLHYDVFKASVKAGKHVICEKPLAITPQQLNDMINISKTAKTVCSGIFQHRFSPIIQTVISGIKRGVIGKISRAELYHDCKRSSEYYQADPWRGSWLQEGGSLLINQSIHSIDILLEALGRPQTVSAKISRKRIMVIETEDYAEAELGFPGNIQASLLCRNIEEVNWHSQIIFFGKKGLIRMSPAGQHDQILAETDDADFKRELVLAKEKERILTVPQPGKDCYGPFHKSQMEDFFSSIQNNSAPRVTVESAALANETVLAMYYSAAVKSTCTLPVSEYKHPVF